MRRPQGYAVIAMPDGPPREADTITCSHCQRIVFVRAGHNASDLGGFCRCCMRNTCGPCADIGTCTPFERKLEAIERRAALHRTLGIG